MEDLLFLEWFKWLGDATEGSGLKCVLLSHPTVVRSDYFICCSFAYQTGCVPVQHSVG